MTRLLKQFPLFLPMLMAALMFFFFAPTGHHTQVFAQAADDADTEAEPTGSPANGNLETVDKDGKRIACADLPEAKGGVLLGRIVPCVVRTIQSSTETFSEKMITWLKPLFYSFLTFVVTMFGIKVLQGERQIHVQAIVLLLKVTLILMVLELIPHTLVPSLYGIMSSSQEVVASTIDSASFHCDVAKYKGAQTPLVWAQMDCVMGKLYGFTTGTGTTASGEKTPNMLLASSMLGLMGGFFFGGTFGMVVFLACVGVLVSMFMLVMRTALSFINGYLIVCVMLIIAPLFLPLILMRVTTDYFEKWWKNIFSAMLMPILITGYAMFALLLYDKMLFAPDALVNQLFKNDIIKSAQQLPKRACSKSVTGDLSLRAEDKNALDTLYKNPYLKNFMQPLLSGGNDLCGMANLPVFKVGDANDPRFKNAKKAYVDLFYDCMKLFILGYLINAGMGSVMNALRSLTGSSTLSIMLNAMTPSEKRFQAGMQGAQSYAKHELGNETGAKFLQRLGPATKAGAQGFFTGISRQ